MRFFLWKYREFFLGYAVISGHILNIGFMQEEIHHNVENFCTSLPPHNQIGSMTIHPIPAVRSRKNIARCIFSTILVHKRPIKTQWLEITVHITVPFWRGTHRSPSDSSHNVPLMPSFDKGGCINIRLALTLMRRQCNVLMFTACRQTCLG